MPVFPSKEWFADLIKILDSDEEYKRVGAEWEGDMIMAVEAEPGKLEQGFFYYQNPHRGEMLDHGEVKSADEKEVAFVIHGPYSVWKSIIDGSADAMQSMMQGKIRVQGNMQQLLKYAKFQQLGMKALAQVETVFIDET
jgi:putative sterol carrier protein